MKGETRTRILLSNHATICTVLVTPHAPVRLHNEYLDSFFSNTYPKY